MLATLRAAGFSLFRKPATAFKIPRWWGRQDSVFGREVGPLAGFPFKMTVKALTQTPLDVKSEFQSTEA